MARRGIKYNEKYVAEIYDFCMDKGNAKFNYPEHNDRYLKQCYYNLQEKANRGIISREEWEKIDKYFKEQDFLNVALNVINRTMNKEKRIWKKKERI